MVPAYVLMEAPPPADISGVVESVRSVRGVKAANAVAGPYDVIAVTEAEDFNAIVNSVMHNIRMIEGISNTITLYVVP